MKLCRIDKNARRQGNIPSIFNLALSLKYIWPNDFYERKFLSPYISTLKARLHQTDLLSSREYYRTRDFRWIHKILVRSLTPLIKHWIIKLIGGFEHHEKLHVFGSHQFYIYRCYFNHSKCCQRKRNWDCRSENTNTAGMCFLYNVRIGQTDTQSTPW